MGIGDRQGENLPPRMGDASQRMTASRVLRDANPVHPHLRFFEHVVESKELPIIAKELKERVKLTHSNLIDYKSLASCDDLKQRFLSLIRDARKKVPKDLVNLVDTRPVNRRQLYERVVAGTKILDVGSGDGRRLKNLIGPDIVTLDPNHKENILKKPHLEKEFEVTDVADRVVTTFNSVTQIGEEKFDNVDGIHVYPNHERFIEAGIAEVQDNGDVKTIIDDKIFIDKPLTKFPVVELSSHSVGFNTYEERKIEVRVAQGIPYSPIKSFGKRHMRTYFKDDYMTLKLNGELCKLEVQNGDGILSFREQEVSRAIKIRQKMNMVLMLERFRDNYYLLQIDNYRGVRPFHSWQSLQYFLKKVNVSINIDGKVYPLRLPLRVDIKTALSYIKRGVGEGVVVRKNNFDYLVRLVHSLDLDCTEFRKLVNCGEDLGLEVELVGEDYTGVKEIMIIPDTEGYVVCGKIRCVQGALRGKNKNRDLASDLKCINELPNLMDMKYSVERM